MSGFEGLAFFKIQLFDLTSGTPVLIGVDVSSPNQAFTFTDSTGRFKIQVKAGYFKADGTTDGVKILGIQATDAAGAIGPMATFTFTLDTTPFVHTTGPTAPHFDANNPLPSNRGGSDSGLAIPVPGAFGTFTDRLTNVTRPVVDGVVDQAAPVTVQLIDKATMQTIGSGQTDASGNFSIQVVAGFFKSDGSTDGAHTIEVLAVHVPRNSNVVELPFTLDTTAPATAPAPSLLPASDSGFSNTDHITNVTQPSFSGTAEASAQVLLFANGNLAGNDLVNAQGNYVVTVSTPLAAGVYDMTVQIVDFAGNASAMSTAMAPRLQIRTNPPSTPSLKLDPGYATPGQPNVTASVPSQYDGTTDPNTQVTIFDNGVQIDSFAEGNTANFTRLLNLTDGQHLLTVTATDVAGNTATFAPPNPDGRFGLEITVNRDALSPSYKFVREIYNDALGRPGSLAEWNNWVPLLQQPNGRFLIANGINRSPEARDFLVKGWYLTYLGRPALNNEEAGWVNALLNGATEEQVLAGMLSVPEYFNHAPAIPGVGGGAPSNTTFVKALYVQILGRQGSDADVAAWVNAIPALGRGGVAFRFLTSLEYRRDVVLSYYQNLLRRPTLPSQQEVDSWAMSSLDITSIRVAFEASQEFYFRVTGFQP